MVKLIPSLAVLNLMEICSWIKVSGIFPEDLASRQHLNFIFDRRTFHLMLLN